MNCIQESDEDAGKLTTPAQNSRNLVREVTEATERAEHFTDLLHQIDAGL